MAETLVVWAWRDNGAGEKEVEVSPGAPIKLERVAAWEHRKAICVCTKYFKQMTGVTIRKGAKPRMFRIPAWRELDVKTGKAKL